MFNKIIGKISSWKTTKKTLYAAIVSAAVYTAVNLIFNRSGVTVDDTLTENVFDFLKWTVVSGGAISGVKILKNAEGGEE